jgi:GTPase
MSIVYHLFTRCSIAPIFTVSCVSGENLYLLRKFLNAVPPTRSPPELHQQPPEFHVDEIFNVPEAGTVLGGVLTQGIVHEGDPVVMGPREDGTFSKTTIATLRRNRTPCRIARAGEAVTVTLSSIERADVRKVSLLVVCIQ